MVRPSASVSPQFSSAPSSAPAAEKPVARPSATGQSEFPSLLSSNPYLEGAQPPGAETKTAVTQSSAMQSETDVQPESLSNSTISNSTINNVQVRLQGENNQRVDVRLVDNNGELRVSVRTSDANLAQSLGERIPELTSGLDSQRLHSEVWTPPVAAADRTQSSPSSSSTSHSENSSPSNYSSNSGGQGGNSRGQNGNPKQPDWLDELEGFPTSVTAARRNQTWLQ